MDLTECLEKLEDFFCANGEPTSNYGVVVRYLLSDAVRCGLYLYAASSTSTGETLRGAKERAVEHIRPREVICGANEAHLPSASTACVSESDLVALLDGGVASMEVHCAIRLQDPPTLAEAHKVAKEERRQTHTGVMKQEKDDVTQHLEALERPYEPLGELDASAAAARTITDVTPPSYASGNERLNILLFYDSDAMVTVPQYLAMIYDKDHQRAPALLHIKKGADDGQSQTTNCYCPSTSQWMLNAV
ncbi:hypothetical protein T08_9871 [Trichinella sp. T8]|nr:hypothetical protein T08_9871 [Trichinella sp. T8]